MAPQVGFERLLRRHFPMHAIDLHVVHCVGCRTDADDDWFGLTGTM
jgi:hypothetical protein